MHSGLYGKSRSRMFAESHQSIALSNTRSQGRNGHPRCAHADGTSTIIREHRADGSYHIMSDRGEIELIDNANH